MKLKKIASFLLALAICFGLAACSTSGHLEPEEAAKYITKLGNYKGLSCDLTSEENAKSLKETLKKTAQASVKITDRAVAKGDVVNIDYEGMRKDTGVIFASGTATGYDLEIGSKTFIDGFEDGLVGHKPGETVKLDLKFPADYSSNKALAGKEVVFTVTINYIKQYTEEDITRCQNSVAASVFIQQIMAGTTFANNNPTDLITAKAESLLEEVKSTAENSGMSYTDYLKTYYNYTPEQMEADALEYATNNVKQEVLLLTIANAAQITFTDAEYEAAVAKEAAKYGYEGKVDEFVEAYGGEDDVRNTLFLTKITDYLVANNEVKK